MSIAQFFSNTVVATPQLAEIFSGSTNTIPLQPPQQVRPSQEPNNEFSFVFDLISDELDTVESVEAFVSQIQTQEPLQLPEELTPPLLSLNLQEPLTVAAEPEFSGQSPISNSPLQLESETASYTQFLVQQAAPVESNPVTQTVLPPNDSVSARSVAIQAVDAIRSDLLPVTAPNLQSITIQVDPPELGVINIQLEIIADQVHAQIVTSELISAELLAKEKDLLTVALADSGFAESHVDISYGSNAFQNEDSDEFDSNTQNFASIDNEETGRDSSLGNIQLVGVNLIA